jgi:hypothetical protein
VINLVSVGLPAYGHDYPTLRPIQAGSPHARYANGCEDWAVALETGSAKKL